MGASASLLTPEIALQLTEPSLQEFYRYQEECEGQGLNDEDMFYMCEKKFNELLEIDKEAAAKSASATKKKEKTPSGTRHNSVTEDFKPDREHLAMMQHDHSEEESLSIELQAILTDANDVDLAEFDQTYTQVLVKKVFDLDKYDRLHRKGIRGNGADTNGTTTPEEGEEQHDTFMCRLCHICFESKTVLESHLEYSDLHRKNAKEREKRVEEAHNEAMRLTALAKNVMKALYMGLPVKPQTSGTVSGQVSGTATPLKKHSGGVPVPGSYDAIMQAVEEKEHRKREARAKWKHSVDKVLHRRMCEKFTHHLMTRMNVPRGVELLYEGSKYFHRTKSTYDLRYLYHSLYDLIEIVPHYVPYNHDTSTVEEGETNKFLAAKRIYLRHSEVVKAVFGYNITHTDLTDGLHVGEAPIMLNTKGSIHDMEVQAMDLFISNRLRIHKSHKPDDALFFDLHGIAHDTLVKELPRRFAPAPVDVEVIANIWRLYAAPTAATSEVYSREGTVKLT